MASKEGAVYFLVASLGVFDGVDDVRNWGGTLCHAGMTLLVTDLLFDGYDERSFFVELAGEEFGNVP